MSTRRQRMDIQVTQGAVNWTRAQRSSTHSPFIAQVVAVYSDRNACDLNTPDGCLIRNIPVQTTAGLIDDQPYGVIDLPAVDDYVIVGWAAYGERHKVIVGTFIPYLSPEFNDDAVNSDNKQFTKKLMEADKLNTYKKIFKSGTTFEVGEDGTITVEVPTGAYALFDEANEVIHVEDPHGNIVEMSSDGLSLTDANGNTITGTSSGMLLEDANGNSIDMKAAGVAINGTNLEVAP